MLQLGVCMVLFGPILEGTVDRTKPQFLKSSNGLNRRISLFWFKTELVYFLFPWFGFSFSGLFCIFSPGKWPSDPQRNDPEREERKRKNE